MGFLWLNIVRHRVNMSLRQDNHNKRVFECVQLADRFYFGTLSFIVFPKANLRVLNFVWRLLYGSKDNRQPKGVATAVKKWVAC